MFAQFAMSFYVAAVFPKLAPSGMTSFELCQGNKCVQGKEFATFGSSTFSPSTEQPVGGKSHYFQELEVTDLLFQHDFSSDLPLQARLFSKILIDLVLNHQTTI